MSIENKLKLYSNTYVKGEVRSSEYETRIKQEKRLNLKKDLADTIFNELPFQFNTYQKTDVKFLIKTFPNFKELHSKASNEEIILSFIFYINGVHTQKNPDFTDPEICELIQNVIPKKEKQLLFPKTYEIIHWKITLHFIQKQPILPTEPKHTDHNILYKG